MKDILIAILSWMFLFLIQLAGMIAGLIVVPVMLLFGKFDEESQKKFTVFNTNRYWIREKFPKVFWPWDNIEDSSTGDHRGWWDLHSFGSDSRRFINRFWWLAIRNPFNNFKRYVIGCDVRNYTISKLAGQDYVRDDFNSTGWQLLKASPKRDSGVWLPRYTFYLVARWGTSDRALVVQLGNKIKLSHNAEEFDKEIDYWKGFTFEINPWKDIS